MKKNKTLDPTNSDAFQTAIKGAKPLSTNKIRLKKPSPPTPKTSIQDDYEERFHFFESENFPQITRDTSLYYHQKHISNKVLRKFRKGQYNIESTLDLHGMTINQARLALDSFLTECIHHHATVVLIIHGKGHMQSLPVLKNHVNEWLQQTNQVLAFCSAPPKDGGNGAIYVLLKSSRGR